MNTIEELRNYFKDDLFATNMTGITIDEVREGYAKCSFKITPNHLNANKTVMGGASYTLADFVFSIAANYKCPVTITLSSNFNYLGVAKGEFLIAEANVIRSGKSTAVYSVDVTDELGTVVAHGTFTGFRK